MEGLFEPYVEALKAEIRLSADRFPDARISTVYFGGGTPTVLAPEQLSSILGQINQSFPVDADAEITIEANPVARLSPRRFNRLSLGVQSLHDEELRLLGRIHTADEAVRAFREARGAGFRNISIDLMYGIPGQTLESWREILNKALELNPEHVSLYSLTVEEGTPFYKMHQAGELTLPGEDAEADMYEEAIRILTSAGFVHYEISNFAKPGFECRHNMTYWRNEPYFGFGAGASSYLEGVRAANVRDVEEYIHRIKNRESPVESQESLTGRSAMGETIFLGLRMLAGVDEESFARRYGLLLQEAFPAEVESLLKRGLIERRDGFIRLTHTGLLFANDVFAEFVG
jgi:oxygen-independent coproporphyrinogen-3 oxidase